MTPYLDEGPRYYKPLTPEHQLLIGALTTRHEGVEAPFIVVDRGDYLILKHPPTVRMTEARMAKLRQEQRESLESQA